MVCFRRAISPVMLTSTVWYECGIVVCSRKRQQGGQGASAPTSTMHGTTLAQNIGAVYTVTPWASAALEMFASKPPHYLAFSKPVRDDLADASGRHVRVTGSVRQSHRTSRRWSGLGFTRLLCRGRGNDRILASEVCQDITATNGGSHTRRTAHATLGSHAMRFCAA